MALEPSDRIRLIREIARKLETEEWHIIDLTLKQFSLPWSNSWSGTPATYVVSMLENAPDDRLIHLARHVGFDHVLARPASDPNYWIRGYFRLFISHLATNKLQAAELKERLSEYGVSAFVAHDDIEPMTEWQDEIEMALATCDAMVALLHDGFHKSNWTDQEIGYAMGRGLLIISVRFGQDPYGFIGRFQALNGSAKPSSRLADEIFEVLRKNKQTRERIAGGLVSRFAAASSFADAKSRVSQLVKAEYWDESLSERCLTAVKENSQINGAFGVPHQVQNIIKLKEHAT